MEINKNLIREIFGASKSAKPTEQLIELFNKFECYEIEALILNNKGDAQLVSAGQLLRSIIIREISAQDPLKLSGIIVAAKGYLDRFIATGDLKSLIIFVMANGYLKIPLKYFADESLTKSTRRNLSNKLVYLLNAMRININIGNTSYYTKDLKCAADDGIANNHIKPVYDFILAVERGGRGFHFNFYLENLIYILFEWDISAFIVQLNKLIPIEGPVFYLQSFPKGALLTLARRSARISNPWVLFETIRQLLAKLPNKIKFMVKEQHAVAALLGQLYKCSPAFYNQAISFFHGSNLFNAALGKQMKDLPDERIVAVIRDLLPLDQYNSLLDTRTVLLNNLNLHVSDQQYQLILDTAYQRWHHELELLLKSDNFFNNLLLTSYGNFVIHYYSEGRNIALIINLMIDLLTKLIWIDSEWCKDKSDQVRKFYLYLSHLYLLSYVYKNKKLRETNILKLFNDLRNKQALSDYMTSEEYDTYLSEIEENLFLAI